MSIALLIKNSSGLPLTGLTPTWTMYINAVTGGPQSQPTFTELGNGHYKFDPSGSTDPAGIIQPGGTAVPKYLFYSAISSVWVFPAWDEFGEPLTGLTPTWHSLRRVSDGTNYTPQPSFTSLGGGLYKTTYITAEHLTGAIDLGTTAFPRYIHYDTEPAGGSGVVLILPE